MKRDAGGSWWWALPVLPIILLQVACSQSLNPASTPIGVGLIVPLTSGVPAAARSVVEGAELAAEEVNAAGGVQSRRLTLATVDDHGVPEDAVRLFEQLAGQGVVGVVGPVTDAPTIAASAAAERLKVVLISPGATAVLPYGGHFVFRTALPAKTQAQALARYLTGDLRIQRIAIIHDSNEYGTSVAMAFAQAATARGATITSQRLYRDGDKDFTRHVKGTLEERAQLIFLAGYPDEGALVLRQFRSAGSTLTLAGSDALYSTDIPAWAGEAAEGLYVPAGFVPDTRLPVVRTFVTKYRTKYGREPSQYAAQAYDAVRLLVAVLRRAGDQRAKIRDGIAGLNRFPGVTGDLSFDRWGDPVRDVTIARLKGGTFAAVQR